MPKRKQRRKNTSADDAMRYDATQHDTPLSIQKRSNEKFNDFQKQKNQANK